MDEHQPTAVQPPSLDPAVTATDDQLLLTYVRDRDVDCPLCGYNLRALTVPRCPECGKALKLGVGLAEPFLKAWIACAVAACLSAGTGILIVIVLAAGGGTPHFGSVFEAVSFFSFVAMIPVAAVILMRRRWFLRQSRSKQILLACIMAAVALAQFGLIPTWIR